MRKALIVDDSNVAVLAIKKMLKEANIKIIGTASNLKECELLLNDVETRHKIPINEIERLLRQLLQEGTIYEPREGYLKKT